MKSFPFALTCAIIAICFVSLPKTSSGDTLFTILSKERAKQLKIEVRALPAGPRDVRVELEYPTEAKKGKNIHVDLEVQDGEKSFLSTTLKSYPTKDDRAVVHFTADRNSLGKITLKIFTERGLGGTANHIHMKDFVDLEKLDQKK
jgi:hypothetical protein